MKSHLGNRIAQIVPTLLLVSVLVFCLQQLMPGDPAVVLAGEERGDPQVLAQIRAELWLDRSLPVHYFHWPQNHTNQKFYHPIESDNLKRLVRFWLWFDAMHLQLRSFVY